MPSPKSCKLLNNPDDFKNILSNYDNFIFDCDGVLWNHNTLTPGANELINKLRTMKKRIFLATNNSTKSRMEYYEKCVGLKLDIREEEIYCTTYVIIYYLKNKFHFKEKLYLIGSLGFKNELEKHGFNVISSGPEQIEGDIPEWAHTKLDPDVKAVIVGFDKMFNFYKCLKAASYLKDPQHLFISTNPDEVFPYPDVDVVIPGTGCLIKCVETAACRKSWMAGKPHDPIYQCILDDHKLDLSRTLMIGDRLNTDILGANRKGMLSIVVLTGVTTLEYLMNLKEGKIENSEALWDIIPDWYANSIADFNAMF